MNEKFFSLPEQKRQTIINAGLEVFSQNSYKKSPMSEIAGAAGISKALLFHYFDNKKELYFFLWKECARITLEYTARYGCNEKVDLFELMKRGLRAKIQLMKDYPALAAFSIKAYYEKDPEVYEMIQASYKEYSGRKEQHVMTELSPEDFRPGIDLGMMYKVMFWTLDGYTTNLMKRESWDADVAEKEYGEIIDFWRKIFVR